MSDIQQFMPVTKVKRGLLDVLKVMQEEDSTITLARNGEPVIKSRLKKLQDDPFLGKRVIS